MTARNDSERRVRGPNSLTSRGFGDKPTVTGCSPSPARSECEGWIRRSEAKYRGMEDEVGRGSGSNTVYWCWFVWRNET